MGTLTSETGHKYFKTCFSAFRMCTPTVGEGLKILGILLRCCLSLQIYLLIKTSTSPFSLRFKVACSNNEKYFWFKIKTKITNPNLSLVKRRLPIQTHSNALANRQALQYVLQISREGSSFTSSELEPQWKRFQLMPEGPS